MSRWSRAEAIARTLLPYAFFVTVVAYAAREGMSSRDDAEPKIAFGPAPDAEAREPSAPTNEPSEAGVAPEEHDAAPTTP